MKKRRAVGNAITYVFLVLISIIWLFPFFGLLMQSFRSMNEAAGGMVEYLMPKKFSIDSYQWLFSGESQFFKWYGNTVIIASVIAVFQTIIRYCSIRRKLCVIKNEI